MLRFLHWPKTMSHRRKGIKSRIILSNVKFIDFADSGLEKNGVIIAIANDE